MDKKKIILDLLDQLISAMDDSEISPLKDKKPMMVIDEHKVDAVPMGDESALKNKLEGALASDGATPDQSGDTSEPAADDTTAEEERIKKLRSMLQ